MAPFTILGSSNIARVSMNDPRPNHWAAQTVLTHADLKSISFALVAFAKSRGLMPAEVEYTVQWPNSPAIEQRPFYNRHSVNQGGIL